MKKAGIEMLKCWFYAGMPNIPLHLTYFLECSISTDVKADFFCHFKLYLADPGEARGSSTNSFTAPPRPNG